MATTTEVRKGLRVAWRIGTACARDGRLEKSIIEQLDHQIRELDNENRITYTMSNSIRDPGRVQYT